LFKLSDKAKLGVAVGAIAVSTLAIAAHPPLNATNWGVGDNAFPYLPSWGGSDLVQAHLYGSTNTGLQHNAFFYASALANAVTSSAMNAAAYNNTNTQTIGAFLDGENGTNASNVVWGSNSIGATYSSNAGAAAHGTEVNGINRSGSANSVVDGVFIVNGGSAKTTAGLVIATSIAEPSGQPDYGIMIAGPHTTYSSKTPATVTGIYVDNVTSGEAMRIQADHRIALTNSGDTYVRYNTATDKVQIVKHNVVVASW